LSRDVVEALHTDNPAVAIPVKEHKRGAFPSQQRPVRQCAIGKMLDR
jgi:hypothetical protein